MNKALLALGAFFITISIVWGVSSNSNNQTIPPSVPEAQEANAYVQSGIRPKKTISPTTTPTTTPTSTLLVPQTLLTPSVSPLASSTPTPTPTRTPTATPTPKPTLPVVSPTPTPSDVWTPTPTPTATPTVTTPTPTSDSSPLTIKTFTSASQFARGSTYTITVQSSPSASCYIEVFLPVTENQSKSAGIWDSINDKPVTKKIDDTGSTSWAWKVGSATKLGFATVKATCLLGGQSASGQFQMEIIAAQ